MQCFCTKNSIPVTPLTYDVTSASKLRYSHFGRIQKTLKSRLNVFCLPVDPLLFRHNVDSCDATPNATLTKTMSLCQLKIWSGPTKLDVKCLIAISTVLVFYTMLISVVQTQKHAKRHTNPLKI